MYKFWEPVSSVDINPVIVSLNEFRHALRKPHARREKDRVCDHSVRADVTTSDVHK